MMELVKTPSPVPSDVFVASAIVGPVVVLQHTPLAVTVTPPSSVTSPPEEAPDVVISEIAVVVTTGRLLVLITTSALLYPVPLEFLAYVLA